MTLDLEGVPPRLFACTPSRLNTWLDCPRRYRFAYLDRPTPPKAGPWAHLSLGNSAHLALRQWWDLPRPDRTPAAAGRLLRRVWIADGFADEDHSRRWCDEAAGWVEHYAEGLDPDAEPVGLERTVALRTGRLALSGRVDRIDLRGDPARAVVVDYKTGRRAPSDVDVRSELALAVYAAAAQATLRVPCHRVELHHLPTGTCASWEHDEQSIGRHLSRAESIAGEAQAAERLAAEGATGDDVFPPRTGNGCGFCDFRSSCPEGQRAAPAQRPWSVLGDVPSERGGSTGFTVG